MSVLLSPIGNDAPFVDGNGDPLNGGLLYTYTAGSSTPENTYTTNSGGTPNANPIVLDSNGYPSSGSSVVEIWLTSGVNYKFALTTSGGTPVWTRDNISGINDTSSSQDQWVSGPAPTYVSGTSFTLVGDQTNTFHAGRRLKSQNTAGTIYSTIVSSAFAAATTVTVVNDSGALDSGLSAVFYGLLSATNPSTPLLADSYPIASGSSDKTKKVRVEVDGLTTATTRTMTIPDRSGTLSLGDVGGTSRKAKMSVTSASATGTFTADELVVETALGGATQVLASYSQACNLGSTGAGGMDTGSAPTNGFVSLYAIAKEDGTASILACAVATSTGSIYGGANMPSGYTYSALIGIWPTNGSSQFVPGYILGRKFFYQAFKSIATGLTGSATLTSQSISAGVPTVALAADMTWYTATTAQSYNLAFAGDASGTGIKAVLPATTNGSTFTGWGGLGNVAGEYTFQEIPLITSQIVYWADQLLRTTNGMSVSAYSF